MSLNHSNYCTNIQNQEDKDILTRQLFDVNIRLFKSSQQYHSIISNICDYLCWWLVTPKEGYKTPHGVSGANAGIPFNIIGVNKSGKPYIMINPKITKYYGDDIIGQSNCGSIVLDKPIMVKRSEFIDVEYYDLFGEFRSENKVDRYNYGLTIQHEVDHNMGILITDRIFKKEKPSARELGYKQISDSEYEINKICLGLYR